MEISLVGQSWQYWFLSPPPLSLPLISFFISFFFLFLLFFLIGDSLHTHSSKLETHESGQCAEASIVGEADDAIRLALVDAAAIPGGNRHLYDGRTCHTVAADQLGIPMRAISQFAERKVKLRIAIVLPDVHSLGRVDNGDVIVNHAHPSRRCYHFPRTIREYVTGQIGET